MRDKQMNFDEQPRPSGQFRLRLPRELHQDLAREAKEQGVSLNSYVLYLLSTRLGQEATWQEASAYYERRMRETMQETVQETVREMHETVSSLTLGEVEGDGFSWQSTGSKSVWAQ